MRIKTIPAIVEEIRKVDARSAVNQGMLRTLNEEGKLQFSCRGNRLVADMDKLSVPMNGLFELTGNRTMPRIRSIHDAFIELREINPELGVSEERIRVLVGLGQLPHIRVGNRAYVSLESFEEPYNECLIYDDYRNSEDAILEEIARGQLAKNNERQRNRNSKR